MAQQGPHRVLRVAGGRPGLHVAGERDLEGDAVLGQVIHQRGVFGRPDTVPDALGA